MRRAGGPSCNLELMFENHHGTLKGKERTTAIEEDENGLGAFTAILTPDIQVQTVFALWIPQRISEV